MENNITQFGIYIKGNNSYIPMATINNTSFPEFKDLKKIPSIERNDDKLELIIYSDNFKETYFTALSRKLALAGANEDINFNVSPMDKENMYKLSTNAILPNGRFIFIPIGWNEILAVFLGDAQKEVVTFFSNMELKPSYSASQDLEATLKVFPENTELAALLPKWQKVESREKEISDYQYVEDVWQQYQEAEKIALKVRYLEKLQVELNGFLNSHPDGTKLTECKERQTEIDAELPKYEKMI